MSLLESYWKSLSIIFLAIYFKLKEIGKAWLSYSEYLPTIYTCFVYHTMESIFSIFDIIFLFYITFLIYFSVLSRVDKSSK